jgi:hypothetical protein
MNDDLNSNHICNMEGEFRGAGVTKPRTLRQHLARIFHEPGEDCSRMQQDQSVPVILQV